MSSTLQMILKITQEASFVDPRVIFFVIKIVGIKNLHEFRMLCFSF